MIQNFADDAAATPVRQRLERDQRTALRTSQKMLQLHLILSISAADLQTIAIRYFSPAGTPRWLSITLKICSVTSLTGRSPFTETSRPLRA